MLYRIQNTSTAWGYWLVILRNFYVSISRILECLGMWGSCILHCVAKWAMVTFKGGNCPKAWNTRFLTGLIFLPTLLVVFIVYTLAFGNSGFLFKDSWDHFQSFFSMGQNWMFWTRSFHCNYSQPIFPYFVLWMIFLVSTMHMRKVSQRC